MQVTLTLRHPESPVKDDHVQVCFNDAKLKDYKDIGDMTFKDAIVKLLAHLHNDTGPAIKSMANPAFADMYFLNGKLLATTSSEYISIRHKESYRNNVEDILKQ